MTWNSASNRPRDTVQVSQEIERDEVPKKIKSLLERARIEIRVWSEISSMTEIYQILETYKEIIRSEGRGNAWKHKALEELCKLQQELLAATWSDE